MCEECYVNESRITPLLNPRECLENHMQYVCGTCGRCICIGKTEKGLQRWKFPFQFSEIAKLYLRTADYTMKKCCGIYEIKSTKGRTFYKIFADENELHSYLKTNKDKTCLADTALFSQSEYREFPNTKAKKLTATEVRAYLNERS
ncbi:MAG: hypothetical protein ACTTKC_09045 [Treponema sp.]|uniref:hypothetical protein n=1 Tax=Treponema sp. TaxID=166 RepID=UPI003FA1ED63